MTAPMESSAKAAEKKSKTLLKSCPVCQKEISKKALSCPHCGEPFSTRQQQTPKPSQKEGPSPEEIRKANKKIKRLFVIALVTFGLGYAFLSFLLPKGEYLDLTPTVTETETREEKIEKAFSTWDGSHVDLTRKIKESMNDPASYEHVETKYWDMKDHLVVLTTFRGKNAFGGVIKNSVKAKVDLDGNVIEIMDQF